MALQHLTVGQMRDLIASQIMFYRREKNTEKLQQWRMIAKAVKKP